MTPHEKAAYDAGLRAVLDMARTVATKMEAAPGAADHRKQVAVTALHTFADAATALALTSKPSPGVTALTAIAELPSASGEILRPQCSGRFPWSRDSTNGHVHGGYDAGCLTLMQ